MWFVPAVVACWGLGAVVERVLTRPAGRWMLGKTLPDAEAVHAPRGEVAGQ